MQQRIDAIAYPPTHTYHLEGLVPIGDLARRLEVYEKIAPGFFSGRLLDVGCNKGFFSLYHKGEVFGIDPNREYVDLCRDLRPDGIFIQCRFGEVMFAKPFDRIFIGNGPHYPYADMGWGRFAEKLAELSCGLVLTEGLVDMHNRDAKNCIPDKKQQRFTQQHRDEAFDRDFIKVDDVASPLVHRRVTLWRKRCDLHHADPAHYAGYLVHIYQSVRELVSRSDVVVEICTRHDRGVIGRQIIRCAEYLFVDRDKTRAPINLDAINDELPKCDVIISTAILHHTEPKDLSALFANMARAAGKYIILSGPTDDTPIFGDHKYHINVDEMRGIAESHGWALHGWRRSGLTEPLAEVIMVFRPCLLS